MSRRARSSAPARHGMANSLAATAAGVRRDFLLLEFAGACSRNTLALFVAVVCVALVTNASFEIWFFYQEHKTSLIRIQREQAEAASAKIGQFVEQIELQLGWTTQLPWIEATLAQRRLDSRRLLRQVPAITELSQLDPSGIERLRVSRLATDVLESHVDLSKDPKFLEAMAGKTYYGPVYFRYELEPYMTLAMAGSRRDTGVSVAEVNLKFIWDVVSQIKVGEHGQAYVVDAQGRLIAHPDINLVLRGTNLSDSGPGAGSARGQRGHIAGAAAGCRGSRRPPGADGICRDCSARLAGVRRAAAGRGLCAPLRDDRADRPGSAGGPRPGALAGMFLARKMVVPIQALQAGAARIGSGDLSQRIAIKTGDELEALADQFNDMAGRLQDSYTNLERKGRSPHARARAIGRRAPGAGRSQSGGQFDARPRECVDDHRRQGGPDLRHRGRRYLCLRRSAEEIRPARDLRHGPEVISSLRRCSSASTIGMSRPPWHSASLSTFRTFARNRPRPFTTSSCAPAIGLC